MQKLEIWSRPLAWPYTVKKIIPYIYRKKFQQHLGGTIFCSSVNKQNLTLAETFRK